ncbi:AlkA N-terminal domain-containing protein [Halomonas sp. V046]|uniref:AlkA N-terminal domain-containing protein n=1 Tax=Halomonas sp. V046 TaxID=3459611 RepID=UPI0040444113
MATTEHTATSAPPGLAPEQCRRARLARDPRFDGRFFVAVRTTGIYCRPICPATPPLEKNVRYFATSLAAAEAGFRPCLRCRPDSAPDSPAWRGTDTTLTRALKLIEEGALSDGSVVALCERLGIGERHLRGLFQRRFGVSPKAYAQHRQCLFAKQLLHQTHLPITEIAYASGFASIRRFNDAFHRRIGLAPREIRRRDRKAKTDAKTDADAGLTLTLSYRPPYAWAHLRDYLARRAIEGLEWVTDDAFGRHLRWGSATGRFAAHHLPDRHAFRVELWLSEPRLLAPVVANLRRVLDLDADSDVIAAHLKDAIPTLSPVAGLRLPGLWSPFEAAVRAVLGQQVTLGSARRLTQTLVDALGAPAAGGGRHFPEAAAIAASDLAFLGMPDSRRQTLRRLAAAQVATHGHGPLGQDTPREGDDGVKGMGPWTLGYASLRGRSAPDIWLAGDAGIRRALKRSPDIDPERAAPWRSYLMLTLWSLDHDQHPDT